MKHKRMGMARIEHQFISHPYLNSSSTMVSSPQQQEHHDVFLESSFSGSTRPRPNPPKFHAEALNTLAARSERKSKRNSNLSPRGTSNITATNKNKNMSSSKMKSKGSDSNGNVKQSLASDNDMDFFAPVPSLPPSIASSPRPRTPAHRVRAPFRRGVSSPASSYGSPSTPLRRRSSSAFNSTPSASPQQYKGSRGEAGVDRALESMLHSLRVAAHSPSPKHLRQQSSPLVSRWSSSSDEEQEKTSSTGHSWFSRKSNESSRSKTGLLSRKSSSHRAASVKSLLKSPKSTTTSIRSIKSGKSGRLDWGSQDIDMDVDVPPLPALPPPVPVPTTNTTPGRGRRMVEGLLKRLTPRKNKPEASQSVIKDGKDGKERKASQDGREGKDATESTRPPLVRSRTAPSLPSGIMAAPGTQAPALPLVPPLPRSSSGVRSVLSRQKSSVTLRLGKSPRSSTISNKRSGRGDSVPPVPALDVGALGKAETLSKSASKASKHKSRRSLSMHLPPPLPIGTFGRWTPPRTPTPSTPRAGTPVGTPTISTPTHPRSPSTPSKVYLNHSLPRGRSVDLIAHADKHGIDGRAAPPRRQSRSPIAFAFARQRSAMSMSLPRESTGSSSLNLPALSPSATAAEPVLLSRESQFEAQSPASVYSNPSPGRFSTEKRRTLNEKRRTIRPVKSIIGMPTLISTTSEMAFTAATGKPVDCGSPVRLTLSASTELPVLVPDTLVVVPEPIIVTEPDVFEADPADTPIKKVDGSGSFVFPSSSNPRVPGEDTNSFVSETDSCYDAEEVITFSTPQRAHRATATTIFSLTAVQALASPATSSRPLSPFGSPIDSPSSPIDSPRTTCARQTLTKLEAAGHSRTDSAASASASGTSPVAETPALFRTASDARASSSESDGVKTPSSSPGTPVVESLPVEPIPPSCPSTSAAADPVALPSLVVDFAPLSSPTGTLTGRVARAAAIAAASDPLKPRRLLQLLPRQQARLARRKAFESQKHSESETENIPMVDLSDDVVMNEQREPSEISKSATPAPAIKSSNSTPVFDPEIGLPIPPASPRDRRPPIPTLPVHLDRTRLRADSATSATEEIPRRWPAWPPQWENGASRTDPKSDCKPDVKPTGAEKKGKHAQSASVNTFGGISRQPSLASMEGSRKASKDTTAQQDAPQPEVEELFTDEYVDFSSTRQWMDVDAA